MLCDTCISIFESEPDREDEWKWDGKDKRTHHLTIESLREAVSKRCNICWRLWEAFTDGKHDRMPVSRQSIARLFESPVTACTRSTWLGNHDGVEVECLNMSFCVKNMWPPLNISLYPQVGKK